MVKKTKITKFPIFPDFIRIGFKSASSRFCLCYVLSNGYGEDSGGILRNKRGYGVYMYCTLGGVKLLLLLGEFTRLGKNEKGGDNGRARKK